MLDKKWLWCFIISLIIHDDDYDDDDDDDDDDIYRLLSYDSHLMIRMMMIRMINFNGNHSLRWHDNIFLFSLLPFNQQFITC